jgi:hypothetical protein
MEVDAVLDLALEPLEHEHVVGLSPSVAGRIAERVAPHIQLLPHLGRCLAVACAHSLGPRELLQESRTQAALERNGQVDLAVVVGLVDTAAVDRLVAVLPHERRDQAVVTHRRRAAALLLGPLLDRAQVAQEADLALLPGRR